MLVHARGDLALGAEPAGFVDELRGKVRTDGRSDIDGGGCQHEAMEIWALGIEAGDSVGAWSLGHLLGGRCVGLLLLLLLRAEIKVELFLGGGSAKGRTGEVKS